MKNNRITELFKFSAESANGPRLKFYYNVLGSMFLLPDEAFDEPGIVEVAEALRGLIAEEKGKGNPVRIVLIDPICYTEDFSNGVVMYCRDYPDGLKVERCSENENLFSVNRISEGLGQVVSPVDEEKFDSFWCTPIRDLQLKYDEFWMVKVP